MAINTQGGFTLTKRLTKNHKTPFNFQKDNNEKTYIYSNRIDSRASLSRVPGTTRPTIHAVHVQYERSEPSVRWV